MKTNGVPAVIMLTAGLIDCVLSISRHLDLWTFTKRLFLVLLVFYVIGCVVKIILDHSFKVMDDKNENENELEEEKGLDAAEEEQDNKEESEADASDEPKEQDSE